VLILDEASQCDVTDLALLSLANRVVVVGDHEQVSPYAIGQDISSVDSLIDELLGGVPNARLLDPKTSVYDVARECFGETIRLVEHFRCVPEIIAFSNALSYSGEIRPLRESNDGRVRPPLVAHRVTNATAENKINWKEIDETAALVLAANEISAYKGLTFGVISIVGEEQALKIEELLRRLMPVDQIEARRILCGTASQFQGDERDVVFISTVHAPNAEGGPLTRVVHDERRKVFNVAASRAKDQLWIVHSLNPEIDLKPDDIRRRLILHAQDPDATLRQLAANEPRTQSPFEREVLQGLTDAGFRIEAQWAVGAYSIDMVAYDRRGNRVAIECDGDRWHPPEKLAEDLGRQTVLERLGWRFLRLRGSEYFRQKQAAVAGLVEKIRAAGIEPDLHLQVSGNSSSSDAAALEVRQAVLAAADKWRGRIRESRDLEPLSASTKKRWGRTKEGNPEPGRLTQISNPDEGNRGNHANAKNPGSFDPGS
jgi:very-short-patch-repair endonuclease